jgi:hypothetical protein
MSIFGFFNPFTVYNDVRYDTEPVCPYLFENSPNLHIQLFGQVDSIVYRNLLRFTEFNSSGERESINSYIDSVLIAGYNYRVDTGLLHPLVFEKLWSLHLINNIGYLQTDLFKEFHKLFLIELSMDSLGNFYHTIGIGWALYLQRGATVRASDRNLDRNNLSQYEPSIYQYPDNDFCIFATFPFQNFVYFEPDCGAIEFCTTTLKLLANTTLPATSTLDGHSCAIYEVCLNSSRTNISDSVIKSSLQLCNSSNYKSPSQKVSYPDYYGTRLLSVYIIDFFPFTFIPLACFIGFVLNYFVIKTVAMNEEKDLKEDMYKYMKANAVFNCIYCVIYIFYPMNSCLELVSTSFCSSIYSTQFAQYFKIVVLTYFGETVKMCANITYIMMSLNRYMLVGKDHPPRLVKLAKLEFKWVIRGSFLICALVNIGHGFEFTIAGETEFVPIFDNSIYDYTHHEYNINFGFMKFYITQYPAVNTSSFLFVYSVMYFVINFLLFFAINTLIEFLIVMRMRRELREKRERLARMSKGKNSNLAVNESRTESEDAKKERRVIIMVVVNSLVNFVFRFPDFLIFLEAYNSSAVDYYNNKNPGLSALLLDIGYLTYILTFSFNFLLFYNFNSKFKDMFIAIFFSKRKLKITKKC